MDATILTGPGLTKQFLDIAQPSGHLVDAAEFRTLMVSHRRMVRADRAADRVKGLRDLDTGEVFFVAEGELLER